MNNLPDDPAERARWIHEMRRILAGAHVLSARMDLADATGWLVVSHDDETGSLHISGAYATPEAALVAAERDHQDVNRGLAAGEPGWTHTVLPLFPPRADV